MWSFWKVNLNVILTYCRCIITGGSVTHFVQVHGPLCSQHIINSDLNLEFKCIVSSLVKVTHTIKVMSTSEIRSNSTSEDPQIVIIPLLFKSSHLTVTVVHQTTQSRFWSVKRSIEYDTIVHLDTVSFTHSWHAFLFLNRGPRGWVSWENQSSYWSRSWTLTCAQWIRWNRNG